MKYLFAATIGLLISILVVSQIRKLAARFRIGSLPSPRKIHSDFKPLLGGFGFTAGILALMFVSQFFKLLPASHWSLNIHFWIGFIVIILFGLWDDVKGVSSKIKFSGQGIAALLLVLGGCRIQSFSGPLGEVFSLGMFSIPFSFLWIIFIINAINILDGLDGLAGGVGLIITTGFVVITQNFENSFLFVLSIGLAVGILGFLRYNYHPASIFMGDVGSLQLGYVLAFLSIESLKIASTHQIYFLTSLVLLGVPVTDALLSFLRRLSEGNNPFLADKQHIHHRLINLGLSHLQTVWLLYLFTIFYVVAGILLVYFQEYTGLIVFIIVFLFTLFWIWRLGYVETRSSMQNFVFHSRRTNSVRKRAPIHFTRIWHKLLLLLSDLVTINLSLYFTHWLKFQSNLFSFAEYRPLSDYFSTPVFLLLTIAWILMFFLNNLYHMDWDISRFDKIWKVSKVITFGVIIISLITIDFHEFVRASQIYSLLIYWITLLIFVNTARLFIIELEKRLKIFEYSLKKTLIVGCNELGNTILQDIKSNPHLIFDVIGFVSKKSRKNNFHGFPVLGDYQKLPELIHQYKIDEVLIAIPEHQTEDFIQLISLCESQEVKVKIPPGTHDVFTGKQVSLVSHAYLQIFPENMVLWQWFVKRIFDLSFGIFHLIVLSPFIFLISIYIYIKLGASAFLKIPILGKNGIPFTMYVFRLNKDDYDYYQNPIYLGHGSSNEPNTGFLKFMYRSRLYKLPQIFNVILGDMSFVGPRPEPPEWYEEYRDSLRFIHRRITVRPGLTGLAQVKYHYELSQKILQERVKFDIFYIENMALRLDVRILLRTIFLIVKKPGNIPLKPVESKVT